MRGLNWTFGRGWYNGGFVDHIDGRMDNIRFSDVALPNEDLISTVIAMAATPTHDTFASRHPVCHNGKGEGSQCWHEVVTKHGLCLTSDIDGENCTDHMKSFEI